MATTPKANGRITQVIGSTFDVVFPEHSIPGIYNAVRIDTENKGITLHLVGEVQQHLGRRQGHTGPGIQPAW